MKKKIRRPADKIAGKGSLSGKLKTQRKQKRNMIDAMFSDKPKKKKGK